MRKPSDYIEPELSRPLGVDKIPQGGMEEHIVARLAEREALAIRFGLISLPRLEAWLSIDHAQGRMVAITGRFEAEVEQTCVVSLEPFTESVRDTIDTLFAPDHMLGAGNPHFDAGEEDDPEPIIGGTIDLGELVAQHLGVALDPYPRKAGAKLAYEEACESAKQEIPEEGKAKPFANLASLVKKKDG